MRGAVAERGAEVRKGAASRVLNMRVISAITEINNDARRP